MGEIRYFLTQEDLNTVAALAGREAVAAYKEEYLREERKRANEKVSITRKKLASYRRVKASIEDTGEFTEDEKMEYRWKFLEDLMGSIQNIVTRTESAVVSLEKKKRRDKFEIQSIDKALELYKAEAERSTSAEFKRRYRELIGKYINEPEMSVAEIAEKECVTEKTVYKDLGIACGIVAAYLLGM